MLFTLYAFLKENSHPKYLKFEIFQVILTNQSMQQQSFLRGLSFLS